ncbi:MAG: enoyl-CoA hydratase [Pseudomonadales bacterium]|nr:enoyl-CoA hydratase [Pseudomonadales bacterium]
MAYENVITERHGKVGVIQMNRPQALNALSSGLMKDVSAALLEFEKDNDIHAIILTGNERAFAAGADISEIKDQHFIDLYTADFINADWEGIAKCKKPIIAAVSGFALGGGCEIAMMCDFIIAADNAKFGQPEVKLGVIPGAGGTQRLARFIGKSKAMDLCLTGRMMDAEEAKICGLASRVVPLEKLMEECIAIGQEIAEYSQPAVKLAKEVINKAYETTLREGVKYERRIFQALFSTEDQKEGMNAFVEKRKPIFQNK